MTVPTSVRFNKCFPKVGQADLTYLNYWRMLHEAGHALGLSHSNTEDSVMDATYRTKDYSPYPTDIAAIKAMYQSK